MNKFLFVLGVCVLLTPVLANSHGTAGRVVLQPKLRVGQMLRYEIGYRAATNRLFPDG